MPKQEQRRFQHWICRIYDSDHTGTWCWIEKDSSLLCQEGRCFSCQIYKEWEETHMKLEERIHRIKISVERLERWARLLTKEIDSEWQKIQMDGLRRESTLLLKRAFLLWVRLMLPQRDEKGE